MLKDRTVKGFSIIRLLILCLVLALVVFAAFTYWQSRKNEKLAAQKSQEVIEYKPAVSEGFTLAKEPLIKIIFPVPDQKVKP